MYKNETICVYIDPNLTVTVLRCNFVCYQAPSHPLLLQTTLTLELTHVMSCVICNSDEKRINPDVFVTTVPTIMPVRNTMVANLNQWSSVLLHISPRSLRPQQCHEGVTHQLTLARLSAKPSS